MGIKPTADYRVIIVVGRGWHRDATTGSQDCLFYECNRYYANRIARTELHRAYTDQQSRDLMSQERVEYVQIRLSSKHPKPDICDYHAKVNLYGLGPGVYPKADAPQPPFYPHCYCVVSPKIDLNPKLRPRFNPDAERVFLASLPLDKARQVAGSIDKRDRILAGKATIEEVYNAGKDELYKWKRVGEVGQTTSMPPPKLPNPIDQRVADAARRYTKQLESLPFDEAFNTVQQAVNDPLFKRFFEEGLAGNFPVGILRPEDMEGLETKVRTVLLSDRSLREHLDKHPEVQLQDYQKIPLILEQGEVWIVPDKPERLIYLFIDGVTYRAALKRTVDGDENYFLTLFKNTKKKPPKGAVRVR